MSMLYAIGLLVVFIIGKTYYSRYQNRRREQEAYQKYQKNYINPLSYEAWKGMEDFKQNLSLAFSHRRPFDGNHYNLDTIMETYKKDRIIQKLKEDIGFSSANSQSHKMVSIGFTVKNNENLFKLFNICEEIISNNTSIAFPINHHFIVVGKDKGVFFISMPYDIINYAPEYERKD